MHYCTAVTVIWKIYLWRGMCIHIPPEAMPLMMWWWWWWSPFISQCYSFVSVIQSVSDGVVQLKGKAGEHSVEFSIRVDSQNLSPVDAALPVHRLAAKAQIKQLEDGEKGVLLFYMHFALFCYVYFYLWWITSKTVAIIILLLLLPRQPRRPHQQWRHAVYTRHRNSPSVLCCA